MICYFLNVLLLAQPKEASAGGDEGPATPTLLRRLALPLLVIVGVSVVGICLVVHFYAPTKALIGLELVKALLQITTVLVLGQIVALVVKDIEYARQEADKIRDRERVQADKDIEYARQEADKIRDRERVQADKDIERERQELDAVIEFKKGLRRQLVSCYARAKNCRRLLRAKAINPPYDGKAVQTGTIVKYDAYDEQMQEINQVELELEGMWHEIQSATHIFHKGDELVKHIEIMKDYLRDLIHQYEKNLVKFSGTPATLSLAQLDANIQADKASFTDFIGRTKGGKFEQRFIEEFRKASALLHGEVLGSTSSSQITQKQLGVL